MKIKKPYFSIVVTSKNSANSINATLKSIVSQTYKNYEIILVDGKPVGAISRVPKKNEIRSNIHVGGSAKKIPISKSDKIICDAIGPELRNRKLFFVGIDIIGKNLIEINRLKFKFINLINLPI